MRIAEETINNNNNYVDIDVYTNTINLTIHAGGYYWGGLKSTEILVRGTDQWGAGPNLKYGLYDASGVTTPDRRGFLFIGGYNWDDFKAEDTIYKLECRNLECEWNEVDEKLRMGRISFLAVFIPDSLLGCT